MTLSNYDRYSRYIHFRALAGSRSYGLHTEDSDYDWRGVYIAPSTELFSLKLPPEQINKPNSDEQYWELAKFIKLSLKANPNILEVLFSQKEHVDVCSDVFRNVLDNRDKFLSKLAYKTYRGYAQSQLKRMEGKSDEEINWKHAMHMLRLLYGLKGLLKDGVLLVDMSEYREELLNVRAGEHSWNYVDVIRECLEEEIEELCQTTSLPDEPDYDWANNTLVETRVWVLEQEHPYLR